MDTLVQLPICHDTIYYYRLRLRLQEYHCGNDYNGHLLRSYIRDSQIDLNTLAAGTCVSKSDLQAMIKGEIKITDKHLRDRIENCISNHLNKMLRRQRTPRS